MRRIIGIHGRIGSGKSTVAKLAAAEYHARGYEPHHRMYAGALKRVVEIISGEKMSTDYDNKFIGGVTDYTIEQKEKVVKPFGMTLGRMLQVVGTDLFRNGFDKDTWLKTMFPEWDEGLSCDPASALVVTDVRFLNEAEMITARGGVVIGVISPQDRGGEAGRVTSHESETSLLNWRGFYDKIYNEGSLADLSRKVGDVFKKLDNE